MKYFVLKYAIPDKGGIVKDCFPRLFHGFTYVYLTNISLDNMFYFQNIIYCARLLKVHAF